MVALVNNFLTGVFVSHANRPHIVASLLEQLLCFV